MSGVAAGGEYPFDIPDSMLRQSDELELDVDDDGVLYLVTPPEPCSYL